jgi:phosphoglucosamine mutase
MMEEIVERKLSLSKLAEPVVMYPQSVKNVVVTNKAAVTGDSKIQALVAEISEELGKDGRILIRESGTEPVIRVMVESSSQKICEAKTDKVINLIKELGYNK